MPACAGVPHAEAQGRWLGASAAAEAAPWVEMSESDARSILGDVDPEVMDRHEQGLAPVTPESIAQDIGLTGDPSEFPPGGHREVMDRFILGFVEGRDLVWGDALQARALRALGRRDDAEAVEQAIATTVAELRRVSAEQERQADDA